MSDDTELSALLSSASLVMIGGLIGAGSRLLERVIVGRALSPEIYGELSIGIAVLTFSNTIAQAGFSQGIPRFMSRYSDPVDRRGTWFTGLVISFGLGLIVAVFLFITVEDITGLLFEQPESVELLYLFIAAIPFVVAQSMAIAGIRGHENTLFRTYTKDLLYPLGRIGLLVAFLALGYGLIAAGFAYLIAAVVTCFVAHLLLNRLIPLIGSVRLHVREMLTFSVPLIISTVLNVLLSRTDTIMVAYFRNSYEVGQYNAAYPIAGGMLVVMSAFGFMYLPIASRLDANDERESIERIYTITTKWIYIVTFPAFLTLVLFPKDVMRIVFGPEYMEAAAVVPILAIGFFLSAAAGRNRETLSALGETQYIMLANGAGFVLNVVLNLVLIPRYGFLGAGITSALSFALVHAVVCGTLKYRHDITPFSRESLRTFVALPAIMLPFVWLVADEVTLTALTLLPFLVVVGLCSLVVVTLVFGLQSEDEVVLEFVEDLVGWELPFVRRYLPNE
jgi:O-antigen/teichoic acid export membrane protein